MTEFEKKQPRAVFISAGEKAFRMGILPGNNPYSLTPYKEFWQRGYKQTEDKFNGTTQRKRTFAPGRDAAGDKISRFARLGPQARTVAANRAERPVISLGRITHFNRKHQTQDA
jgi:hypothetical protein